MSTGFSERRGAHRPASQGPTSAIPWLVAAVAILLIVGFASGWFGGSSAPAASTEKASSAKGGAAPAATTSKSPATTKAPAASPTTPAATADRTLPVSVLNSTSTSGLAAKGAARLKTAGWAIRSTGNYRGGVSGTTVFYGSAALRATAQAVAADLGLGAVTESADFGPSRVTVVLAGDFQP